MQKDFDGQERNEWAASCKFQSNKNKIQKLKSEPKKNKGLELEVSGVIGLENCVYSLIFTPPKAIC